MSEKLFRFRIFYHALLLNNGLAVLVGGLITSMAAPALFFALTTNLILGEFFMMPWIIWGLFIFFLSFYIAFEMCQPYELSMTEGKKEILLDMLNPTAKYPSFLKSLDSFKMATEIELPAKQGGEISVIEDQRGKLEMK